MARLDKARDDGATYSSDQKRGGVVVLEDVMQNEFEQGGNLMLTMDAPEHTRYRKLVNRGFTPRQMRMIEPHIRELTNKIIDDVIESGECDFVVDVAAEVPLQVIAEMIGVPQEDRHKLFEWSNRMIGSEDPEYTVSAEEVMNAQVEMFMYANELAAERRANPRDDIVTALLEAEVNINYLYSFIPHPQGKSLLALSMEDNDLAEQVLRRHQFRVLNQGDISR